MLFDARYFFKMRITLTQLGWMRALRASMLLATSRGLDTSLRGLVRCTRRSGQNFSGVSE